MVLFVAPFCAPGCAFTVLLWSIGMNPLEHTIYRLRNAKIDRYPYPHFFVEKVFPEGFYRHTVLKNLPNPEKYKQLSTFYKARGITDGKENPDWLKPFDGPYFGQQMLKLFSHEFFERYPNQARPNFRSDWRFVQDGEGYSIGPHTDALKKVLSLLFYLPQHWADEDFGTGIYVPKDHKQTCEGGPHYPFEGFEEVFRAPFSPNSCFGFWKTANSWHAVEPISRKITRNVLLYNLYEE